MATQQARGLGPTRANRIHPHKAGVVSTCLVVISLLSGCNGWGLSRRSAGPTGSWSPNRQDPALSGDGRVLASVVDRGGRDTLLLQEQPTGRELPLRHLRRLQPHRSPSLSWNGRYVALLVQRDSRRLAVVEDRASGELLRLPLPADQEVNRLALSPSGRRLALEVVRNGVTRVELFDLANRLEADAPAGALSPSGAFGSRGPR